MVGIRQCVRAALPGVRPLVRKEDGADRKRTEAIRPLAETAANLKQNV